ncbi:hypothetical protein [Clostridium thermosuccinogenes]|uniref:hypothetical protein n=1 Tax=Clostridium thermosuccinogenes TaxID=84032 RepID=UPI000CCC7E16|nr:hypothetical protein [Pseudoclostridium thermosuccinogenes]PNT93037.1 hypothetical protein CDQ83_05690 [Pseudoclostridium thermosuccinogenes]
MSGNLKGKRAKDFEAPMDSIIHNTDFCSSYMSKTGLIGSVSITPQHFSKDEYDSFWQMKRYVASNKA